MMMSLLVTVDGTVTGCAAKRLTLEPRDLSEKEELYEEDAGTSQSLESIDAALLCEVHRALPCLGARR